MSRLESFIRRLEAQRACLDLAARMIGALPGNVLEFGLGNGRTYDHLRSLFSSRDIFVFDRQVAAHPDCIPAADRLFVGDFIDTLPRAATQLGANSALAHLDVGSGDVAASRSLLSESASVTLQLACRDDPLHNRRVQPAIGRLEQDPNTLGPCSSAAQSPKGKT